MFFGFYVIFIFEDTVTPFKRLYYLISSNRISR